LILKNGLHVIRTRRSDYEHNDVNYVKSDSNDFVNDMRLI